jgi:hypothetical protein
VLAPTRTGSSLTARRVLEGLWRAAIGAKALTYSRQEMRSWAGGSGGRWRLCRRRSRSRSGTGSSGICRGLAAGGRASGSGPRGIHTGRPSFGVQGIGRGGGRGLMAMVSQRRGSGIAGSTCSGRICLGAGRRRWAVCCLAIRRGYHSCLCQ